jgi:hypothetical protein
MKFDALSGNWVNVGVAGFSADATDYTSLAFDNGIPYVAFMDWTGGLRKVSVMKFNALSGNWVNVGPAGFFSGEPTYISLAFDNGTPYVAFRGYIDYFNPTIRVGVMKFDALSGSWVYVGIPLYPARGKFCLLGFRQWYTLCSVRGFIQRLQSQRVEI